MLPKYKQKGFTMLELVLVVAMIGLLASFSINVSSGVIWRTDLHQAQSTTVSSLRQAQILAQSGVENVDWGVHIEESTVTIFQGNDFENRDETKDERYDLGSSLSEETIDVVFHRLSGIPYDSPTEINLTARGGTVTLTVNSLGTINY